MNLLEPLRATPSFFYLAYLRCRFMLPRLLCRSFTSSDHEGRQGIGHTYVINLDRESGRWADVSRELNHILNTAGASVATQTTRYSAVDATDFLDESHANEEVYPCYTLADQLFVEPQPRALPDKFELNRPIQMSLAEIAVARSHIGVWKSIAEGRHSFALVLEDDIWFDRRFARDLDAAWLEMELADGGTPRFDVLYLSYKEVKHGARKEFLSKSVFQPERGLWYLSGYVLSKTGAAKLLDLLPCRGPVDLWINHQFSKLDVRAIRHSRISQRLDLNSTNSYSILPSLTKIGIINDEGAAPFHGRPKEQPVFAFGAADSGASSLAMAMSMLGYRCCSDLDQLSQCELNKLLTGSTDRIFNAYVNIGCLTEHVGALKKYFPRAKFIVTVGPLGVLETETESVLHSLEGSDVVQLHFNAIRKWDVVCEHLRCAPPACAYPHVVDVGQRKLVSNVHRPTLTRVGKALLRDRSPWVIEPHLAWGGIRCRPAKALRRDIESRLNFADSLETIDTERWILRDDTFPGNLGLFRPANVVLRTEEGVALTVKEELLGVRDFSAAAVSSRQRFLFGRFEVAMRATRVPGLVTGFFLHRDSPRQEIDIEIVGNRSDHLLVNVFYNPGEEGTKFDYGYRGAPTSIALGFDASDSIHRFAIEWEPCEIRWFVDDRLVHSRSNWDPTPIPHLPMTLHVNTWPSRSRELAGRLARRALPAAAAVRVIAVDATVARTWPAVGHTPMSDGL